MFLFVFVPPPPIHTHFDSCVQADVMMSRFCTNTRVLVGAKLCCVPHSGERFAAAAVVQ